MAVLETRRRRRPGPRSHLAAPGPHPRTDRGVATWIAGQALPGLGAALAAAGMHDEARNRTGRRPRPSRKRLQLPGPRLAEVVRRAGRAGGGPTPTGSARRPSDLHHAALTIPRRSSAPRLFNRTASRRSPRHGAAIQPTLDDGPRPARGPNPRGAAMGPAPHGVPAAGLRHRHRPTCEQALGEPGFDAARRPRVSTSRSTRRSPTYAAPAAGRRGRARQPVGRALTPTELEGRHASSRRGSPTPRSAPGLFISRGTVQ